MRAMLLAKSIGLLLVGFLFSIPPEQASAGANLTCRVQMKFYVPSRWFSTPDPGKLETSLVEKWEDCYEKALNKAHGLGFFMYFNVIYDFSFGFTEQRHRARGFNAYFYVDWQVNDSVVGYLNGSSGQVNCYSPHQPGVGDSRLTTSGYPLTKESY